MIVNAKGQKWDVESVDGNTVTLVGGQTIEVNDKTLAVVQAQMAEPEPEKPARKRLFEKKQD